MDKLSQMLLMGAARAGDITPLLFQGHNPIGDKGASVWSQEGTSFSFLQYASSLTSTWYISSSADDHVMAFGSQGRILVFDRNKDVFSEVSISPTLPSFTGNAVVSVSPCGTYLAVGMNTSPWILMYKRGLSSYEQITLDNTGSGPIIAAEWTPDGKHLLSLNGVSQPSTRRLMIFQRDGDNFSRVQNISSTLDIQPPSLRRPNGDTRIGKTNEIDAACY